MKKKQIIQKLEEFENLLIKQPNKGILWLDYGDFLETHFDCPFEVVEAYKKAAIFLPGKDLRLRLGVAYSNVGQIEKGINLIEQSLSENPRSHGYCMLAFILIQESRLIDARTMCKKAIKLDPLFEESYYLLGETFRGKSCERAIENYQRAISLDPNYQLAWQALGRELVRKKKIREGILALSKALEIDPEDGWARIYLANAYWRIGEHQKAKQNYEKAISENPHDKNFSKWYDEFKKSTLSQ